MAEPIKEVIKKQYIQCAQLLSKPEKAKKICESLAEKIKKEFTNISKIPEELDYIKDLIRNQILSIEQITNRSFLMQIVEEELNK